MEALRLTPTELRRLWGFFYDAYCCNHAPGAAAEVKLEIGEWAEVLGDHGVPVAEANALFAAQDIADLGFGIDWRPVDGAPRLRVSRLRPEATRKTLLPAAAQLPAAS